MIRWLVLSTLFLSACTQSPIKTYNQFVLHEGNWQTTGTVQLNMSISQAADSAFVGELFSVSLRDTISVETFVVTMNNGSLLYNDKVVSDTRETLHMKISTTKKAVFENHQKDYPNRVVFGWKSDTSFTWRKENSNGNKVISFEMRKR